MEAASPARLYAAVVGALLFVLGVVGFFYDASFGSLDSYEQALGALQANGWLNLFYLATGAVGLLVGGVSSRTYSLTVGLLYTLLAIVGWGSPGLNLVVGVLGLAAVAATPKPSRGSFRSRGDRKERRKSKPRAKPAGKSA